MLPSPFSGIIVLLLKESCMISWVRGAFKWIEEPNRTILLVYQKGQGARYFEQPKSLATFEERKRSMDF